MKGKIIKYERDGILYHIKVEEVTENYVFGPYAFLTNGVSKVMRRGMFEFVPGDKIEFLKQTELWPIKG